MTTQDFTGKLVVTEDAGPDDHHFCPTCDRELEAETVVARGAGEGQFRWDTVSINGDLQLAVAIDDEFMSAWGNGEHPDRVRELLAEQGGRT